MDTLRESNWDIFIFASLLNRHQLLQEEFAPYGKLTESLNRFFPLSKQLKNMAVYSYTHTSKEEF